jgi:hypothetical protein
MYKICKGDPKIARGNLDVPGELFNHEGRKVGVVKNIPGIGFEWGWSVEQGRTDYWLEDEKLLMFLNFLKGIRNS